MKYCHLYIIDSAVFLFDEAQRRHYKKWPILGLNVGTPETDGQPLTYAGEIDKFKLWISKRLHWLDANMPAFVVTEIDQPEIKNSCLLYPNPATSQLTIQSVKPIKKFAVYSIDEKSMISLSSHDSLSITMDIGELSPGFYMIRSTFADGSQWIGKFLKEK